MIFAIVTGCVTSKPTPRQSPAFSSAIASVATHPKAKAAAVVQLREACLERGAAVLDRMAQIVVLQRQRAHPLAGGGEDGVAQSRRQRRHRRVAHPPPKAAPRPAPRRPPPSAPPPHPLL